MDPIEAWDIYVGNQTPSAFMEGETDAEQAVADYASGHPFWNDLTPEDGEAVKASLVRYITDALAF